MMRKPYCRHRGFNSRSREGSDLGASSPRILRSGFNSRSREGSDATGGTRNTQITMFQFTLP